MMMIRSFVGVFPLTCSFICPHTEVNFYRSRWLYYQISLSQIYDLLQDNVKSGATLDSSGETHSVSYSNMLEKLVMEKDMKFVAFAEEVNTVLFVFFLYSRKGLFLGFSTCPLIEEKACFETLNLAHVPILFSISYPNVPWCRSFAKQHTTFWQFLQCFLGYWGTWTCDWNPPPRGGYVHCKWCHWGQMAQWVICQFCSVFFWTSSRVGCFPSQGWYANTFLSLTALGFFKTGSNKFPAFPPKQSLKGRKLLLKLKLVLYGVFD